MTQEPVRFVFTGVDPAAGPDLAGFTCHTNPRITGYCDPVRCSICDGSGVNERRGIVDRLPEETLCRRCFGMGFICEGCPDHPHRYPNASKDGAP